MSVSEMLCRRVLLTVCVLGLYECKSMFAGYCDALRCMRYAFVAAPALRAMPCSLCILMRIVGAVVPCMPCPIPHALVLGRSDEAGLQSWIAIRPTSCRPRAALPGSNKTHGKPLQRL